MKNQILKFFMCFYLLSMNSNAQQSFVSSGNNASSTTGSVSYSIGQINYISINSTSGTVSQGNQQAFEIYTLSVDPLEDNQVSIIAYPNPTNTFFDLSISHLPFDQIESKILDMNGKLIKELNINAMTTRIYFSDFPNGIYHLVLYNENKLIKSVKILKN